MRLHGCRERRNAYTRQLEEQVASLTQENKKLKGLAHEQGQVSRVGWILGARATDPKEREAHVLHMALAGLAENETGSLPTQPLKNVVLTAQQ